MQMEFQVENSIQRRSGNLMDSQWKSGGMLEIPVNSKRVYFMCSFQKNCNTIQTAHSSSKGGELWKSYGICIRTAAGHLLGNTCGS